MKTKTSFMHLLEHKAGFSADPVAMVPAPSSLPEFFLNTATTPFHKPMPGRPLICIHGNTKVAICGRGVKLPGIVPIMGVAIINDTKGPHPIKTFGQN